MRFDPEKVDLIFKCPNEDCPNNKKECSWPVSDLVQTGTAICNECDDDMIIVEVEVDESLIAY